MKFEINPQALRDLEKQLTQTLQVPRDGSEADAMRTVKEQYKQKTGVELDDDALRGIVRKARGE
ncbi:hypothetical protein ACQPXH_01780 [Nocardia sp. CA-135953]|uniref:hypothetical protein n=1 Tax=Nocardia sp. CA-135953 TaxID=3239978 RepID=UPI003D98E50D